MTSFFEQYLFCTPPGIRHQTVVFHDGWLPEAVTEGLSQLSRTRLHVFGDWGAGGQAEILRQLDTPGSYLSVLDLCAQRYCVRASSAIAWLQATNRGDYTSLEVPRLGLTRAQVEHVLAVCFRGNPQLERERANSFFELLGSNPQYRISIRTGQRQQQELVVGGPDPWMELCGPLLPGDIRFFPGAEVFYAGGNVSGSITCSAGINLLPLRGAEVSQEEHDALLELGRDLDRDPLTLSFCDGRLTRALSEGRSAERFLAMVERQPDFGRLCEIGIGFNDAAAPVVRDWANPTNESVPGVHLGLGADPANPAASSTGVHFDLMFPDAVIDVQGERFYDGGGYRAPEPTRQRAAAV